MSYNTRLARSRATRLPHPLTPYLRTYFTHMKTNANAVVQRPEFATLANAALVKFHMFCAGVEGADEAGKKRKREGTSE